MRSYQLINRRFFSLWAKVCTDQDSNRSYRGKLFHTAAAETANSLVPKALFVRRSNNVQKKSSLCRVVPPIRRLQAREKTVGLQVPDNLLSNDLIDSLRYKCQVWHRSVVIYVFRVQWRFLSSGEAPLHSFNKFSVVFQASTRETGEDQGSKKIIINNNKNNNKMTKRWELQSGWGWA